MASTSTNKQPLMVDRVLHYVVSLNSALNDGIDITGSNTAALLVNAIGTDGAVIEDVYSLARSTSPATINLYMSTAADYLRPNEAVFIGNFTSGTEVGGRTRWQDLPKVLAPVPAALFTSPGDKLAGEPALAAQFRALYIPKGRALWAARSADSELTDAPLCGCQGGWY